jgi:hypothetical protein
MLKVALTPRLEDRLLESEELAGTTELLVLSFRALPFRADICWQVGIEADKGEGG